MNEYEIKNLMGSRKQVSYKTLKINHGIKRGEYQEKGINRIVNLSIK
jgi:hypothetical protein